jgi:hypothetical protein
MSNDELRDALDRAAGHGSERDFTDTWSQGRRMRRRRQTAQGLGVTALAAAAVGAFALGGGEVLGAPEPINPATPTVPDTVVATSMEPDSDDDVVTLAPPTPAEAEEASEAAGTADASPTPGATSPAPSTESAPPLTESPTLPTTAPTTDPTPGSPASTLVVLPNPCDDPQTGLLVKGGDATPAAVARAQELLDLASSCELDGLIALAEDQGTRLSFGGVAPEAAFSGEDGRERVHAMATLLANYPPKLAVGSDGSLTAAEWPLLNRVQWGELVELGIASPQEVETWEQFGGYVGWRILIEDDGLWSGMVAGD